MKDSLEQYFIQHGYLDLPGIGTIRLSKTEATWEDDVLIAPKETILFDPILNKPSKRFYIYLADLLGISSEQAAVKLDQILQEFKEKTFSDFEIGSLGTLHKQADVYTWKSKYDASTYYNNVTIKPLNSSDSSIKQLDNNTNRWLIWALILLITALGLILYKQI